MPKNGIAKQKLQNKALQRKELELNEKELHEIGADWNLLNRIDPNTVMHSLLALWEVDATVVVHGGQCDRWSEGSEG